MIVQLTGTLLEVLPTHVILDVQGVGYEMGVSATTAAQLPQNGTPGVTMLTRLAMSQDAVRLYGFATRDERALFDRLVQVSGIGPKVALSVLSTFTPAQLAEVVVADDAARMSKVPGVGKKTAQRLLLELKGVFAKDPELQGLAGRASAGEAVASTLPDVADDVLQALLSMGFSPQEAELGVAAFEKEGASSVQEALSVALKKLGGRF